jgi:hypothetical protein
MLRFIYQIAVSFLLNLSSATNYKDQSHHQSSTFYLY